MTTYPGLPGPIVCDYLSREESRARYAPGTEFQIGKIELVSNTGTYVDTPFHRYPDGADLARQPLWPLAGRPALVVRPEPEDGAAIGAEAFARGSVSRRRSRWSSVGVRPRRFTLRAHLQGQTPGGRGALAESMSAWSTSTRSPTARGPCTHTVLLVAGIPIVEHMTGLAAVPDGARFYAVPPPIEGMGTFPVRAFAVGA